MDRNEIIVIEWEQKMMDSIFFSDYVIPLKHIFDQCFHSSKTTMHCIVISKNWEFQVYNFS